MTVHKSLLETTKPENLEHLANYARFVARNPSVKVHDTTSNEGYHNELKGFFRNIMSCSKEYAKTHAKIASEVKLIGGCLKAEEHTRAMTQTHLLHKFCALLENSPLTFNPKLE